MKKLDSHILWGGLLILLGLLFGLQSLGVVGTGLVWGWVWALIFGAAGAAFLYWYLTNRESWWAIIPGLTLLGLGALIFLGSSGFKLAEVLGGALFMGAIGLAFWIIYARDRTRWWAIIPGGVMFSLAALILLSELFGEEAVVGVFFLGLAATFGLVYLLPTGEERMRWALIPAAILGVMGLIFFAAGVEVLGWLWPLALLVAGGYLVLRALRSRAD